jgi:hypothetical protein
MPVPAPPTPVEVVLQTAFPLINEQSASCVQGLHVPLLHKEAVAEVQSELDLH